jgi:hypothetical protein
MIQIVVLLNTMSFFSVSFQTFWNFFFVKPIHFLWLMLFFSSWASQNCKCMSCKFRNFFIYSLLRYFFLPHFLIPHLLELQRRLMLDLLILFTRFLKLFVFFQDFLFFRLYYFSWSFSSRFLSYSFY